MSATFRFKRFILRAVPLQKGFHFAGRSLGLDLEGERFCNVPILDEREVKRDAIINFAGIQAETRNKD
jgi:hypothetical protein